MKSQRLEVRINAAGVFKSVAVGTHDVPLDSLGTGGSPVSEPMTANTIIPAHLCRYLHLRLFSGFLALGIGGSELRSATANAKVNETTLLFKETAGLSLTDASR